VVLLLVVLEVGELEEVEEGVWLTQEVDGAT
jgi:hypothetical protein